MDELAVTVENKGLFADVTQGHVLKWLKRLHNAGRIRIEDIRIGQTGMKRKRNVVGIVDLLVLHPPFKRPKNVFKEELDRNYVPERDFSKKEREVLRNALTVMRPNAALPENLPKSSVRSRATSRKNRWAERKLNITRIMLIIVNGIQDHV